METAALPTELYAFDGLLLTVFNAASKRNVLLYLCLLVDSVFSVKGTVLFKFQLFLGITPVFAGSIVFPLAFTTLEGYQLNHLFLTRHILLLHIY